MITKHVFNWRENLIMMSKLAHPYVFRYVFLTRKEGGGTGGWVEGEAEKCGLYMNIYKAVYGVIYMFKADIRLGN